MIGDQQKIKMFLDWFNNFLTIERFAEYYNLNIDEAKTVIEQGRELHEANVKKMRGENEST